MRLGQIAKKAGVTPSKIVEFLSKEGVEIINHPNTKLSNELLDLIFENYLEENSLAEENAVEVVESETTSIKEVEIHKPPIPDKDELEAPAKEETELEKEILAVEETTVAEILSGLDDERSKEDSEVADVDESGNVKTDEVILIRAEKVELQGLKVVGKIELPEPKVKAVEEGEAREPMTKPARGPREMSQKRSSNRTRRTKRELSPQELRNRKENRDKRAKIQEEEKLRERRKDHYNRRVKARQPKPSVPKPQAVKSTTMPTEKRQLAKRKSFFGKVWQWMNT